MKGRIFLYGAPASGKSTLGRRLAARLNVRFADLDDEIAAREGRTIPEIFASDGEAAFRDIESAALSRECGGGASPDSVVSLGGGTLLRAENRSAAEASGPVFCLDAPDDAELERRVRSAGGSRPLGNRARERAPHYASFPKRVAASFEVGPSLVVIGRGIARDIAAGVPLVADATVARLHGAGFGEPLAVIPSGEEHKTLATVASLWSAFARAGLGRRDVVASLGGGVTGDLAGFAAATWMRGIDWFNFPTTLLSMVDASTGGKTGCDLPEGKNLAGAFHAPRLVVIDTSFLETLPADVLADGRAEMIKHEAVGGLERSAPPRGIPSAAEIARNLAVKAEIVRRDPLETKGLRILLNCGHTVGHAVEVLSGYSISHGSAVAIGCVEEARLAVKLGLAPSGWPDEFAARFAAASLPVSLPRGMTADALAPLMAGDKKKTHGGVVEFALPCGWGDVRAVRVDVAGGMRKC